MGVVNNILIIEDDPAIREGVRILMEGESFHVEEAVNGFEGLKKISDSTHLVILDVMMPGISGYKTCEEIRKKSNVPVLFLTAKDLESDKLLGLMAGGDDYLVKPFGMMEMVSRIKAVLRRCMPKKENKTVYVNGIIEMNVEEHTVSVSGESICLTYKEYEILKIFLMHPGMAYTRNRLLSEVWGIDSYGESRTVDMHIKTLRQKLGDGGRYIVTVRNVGYKMEVHND